MAIGGAISWSDVYMHRPQAIWAMVGIAVASYVGAAMGAGKIFDNTLERHFEL